VASTSIRSSGRTRASRRERLTLTLLDVFARLDRGYGAETWHWSPDYVRGAMDVVAGAILVQHTTWTNAERALERLRDAGALEPEALAATPLEQLAELVRVSGTPSVKARRLHAVARTIIEAGGLDALFALQDDELRARLLATHGIGRETADAIMLYAAGRPSFVVDAYTKRLFRRLDLAPDGDDYEAWRAHFERSLPSGEAVRLYQRYHAAIVLHGKAVCRAKPRCAGCPLLSVCPTGADGRRIPGRRPLRRVL
jgi:endonuclease-3 related protein